MAALQRGRVKSRPQRKGATVDCLERVEVRRAQSPARHLSAVEAGDAIRRRRVTQTAAVTHAATDEALAGLDRTRMLTRLCAAQSMESRFGHDDRLVHTV